MKINGLLSIMVIGAAESRKGDRVISQELAMGLALIGMSLFFLQRAVWIVAETRKGQWLKSRLGEDRAVMTVRLIAMSFALIGGLLAAGVIEPWRWE
ncbi:MULTISPECIES: hypothetical protein [Planctopirus]|nr:MULTISPECIES: hypothetical protein [Planctopirus]